VTTLERSGSGLRLVQGEVGFCYGVERAVNILKVASLRYGRIITLGPIVHNSHVVRELAARGVVSGGIDDLNQISPVVPNPSAEVIAVTAHGTSPHILARAYETGIAIIDTTCPTVRRAQQIVESLSTSGTPVVVFGDSNHTEVEGLIARSRGGWVAEEPFKLAESLLHVGLVSQTTKPPDRYIDFVQGMKQLNPGIEFDYYNTICQSVIRRIRRAREVSKKVELMLIIGDRMSANTNNLLAICSNLTEAYLIESKDDIDQGWLKGKKVVGITSGTSTPMDIIDQVEKYLLGG